jgi:hypothetical protein
MFLNPDVFSTEDRLPGSLGDDALVQPKKPTSGESPAPVLMPDTYGLLKDPSRQ